MHGVKPYGINRKEALREDWEELNIETYVCMFKKQIQGLLLIANIN